jgi:peptidoglycan/LPS O-acetylase OafA/YrhL
MDGLRALACLTVMIVHTWDGTHVGPSFGSAWSRAVEPLATIGLVLFFALSGFLLYRPFAAAILAGQPLPSIRGYLRNRALRILPAYWVILGVAAAAAVFALPGHENVGGAVPDIRVAVLNVLLLQSYTPHSNMTGIPPAWSLNVEIAFYLVLPLAVLGVARLANRLREPRKRAWLLCVPPMLLWILGVTGKLVAHRVFGFSTSQSTWAYVFQDTFLAKADLFTWGMIAAVAVSFFDFRQISARQKALIGVVGWLLIPISDIARQTPLAALACGLIIVWVAANFAGSAEPTRPARLFTSRPMAFIGARSYSVYLWHWPVILWLDAHGALWTGHAGLLANVALVTAISIALSTATFQLVELPAMRRKRPATRAIDIPTTLPAGIPDPPQIALGAATIPAGPPDAPQIALGGADKAAP